MSESSEQPNLTEARDARNKIKKLLEHQRYAVTRASAIGMSIQEATEMQARIREIEKLLDFISFEL